MIRRINKFISLLLVVAICLYVVIMNPDPLTIHFSSSSAASSHTGIILVAVFFFGAIVAGFVGILLGVRAYWRERRYISQQRQREAFFEDFVEARNLCKSGEYAKAKEKWERIIKREKDTPAGAIARIEFSKTLRESGDAKQALKALDEARSILPDNIEILFRAAELNEALGNKTAAIDNLALVMYHGPSRNAAQRLCALSEELGRFEDALEYNKQLQRLGGNEQACLALERHLRFKLLLKQSKPEEQEKLQQDIHSFLRQYGDTAEPLIKLAELSEKDGRIDEAAQYLARAARASKAALLWHDTVKFWLRHDNPQRALAAARAASNESSGEEKIRMNIDLARLYLTLNMPEDASKVVDETQPMLKEDSPSRSELNFMLQVLRGVCFMRLGRHAEADSVWEKLGRYDESRHISLLRA